MQTFEQGATGPSVGDPELRDEMIPSLTNGHWVRLSFAYYPRPDPGQVCFRYRPGGTAVALDCKCQ